MSDIHVTADGTATVTKVGLPYKNCEGVGFEGVVNDYITGDTIEAAEVNARLRYAWMINWWKRYLIPVVSDDDWKTVIGYHVEGYRTRERYRQFKVFISNSTPIKGKGRRARCKS